MKTRRELKKELIIIYIIVVILCFVTIFLSFNNIKLENKLKIQENQILTHWNSAGLDLNPILQTGTLTFDLKNPEQAQMLKDIVTYCRSQDQNQFRFCSEVRQ